MGVRGTYVEGAWGLTLRVRGLTPRVRRTYAERAGALRAEGAGAHALRVRTD